MNIDKYIFNIDNSLILDLLTSYLLNTNNRDDINILIKISILSKAHYKFLSKKLIYHKTYIKSRLRYLPIIQPKFYKYSFDPITESELYTPSTLIKYLKRSDLSVDEIIDFNVYLISNCIEYAKSTNMQNDYSVYGINKSGRIIQLPTSEGYVGTRSTTEILKDQIIMRIRKNTSYSNKKTRYYYAEIDYEVNMSKLPDEISGNLNIIRDRMLLKLNKN